MPPPHIHPGPRPDRLLNRQYQTTLDRVARLFNRLDAAYSRISDQYGFVCHECEDNCCRSLFYHHTIVEYTYLYAGFKALPYHQRQALIEKALRVSHEQNRSGQGSGRVFCPLNEKDRCLVYQHRPMICRLHGLPHELHYPGRPAQIGPGCDAFAAFCSKSPYIPFDRTPYFKEMAEQERELRQEIGIKGKIKLTVAEMVIAFTAE